MASRQRATIVTIALVFLVVSVGILPAQAGFWVEDPPNSGVWWWVSPFFNLPPEMVPVIDDGELVWWWDPTGFPPFPEAANEAY